MTDTVPTRSILGLVGLLLFHLILLSVQFRTSDGSILLRSIGLTVLAPFATGLQLVSSTTSDLLHRYALLQGAEIENRRLKAENDRLKLELHRFKDLAALLPRTADYQALQEQRAFDTVVADVIGKTWPFVDNHILINAGNRLGVRHDSAVLTPEGVVGRVVVAGPFSAQVELITSKQGAAGARLEGSRVEGVVHGDGVPWLYLRYIPFSTPVEVGELVVTSGTDQVYPRGLPVGTVESARRDSPIDQTIRVRPAVDLSALEQVLVVVKPPQEPDEHLVQEPEGPPASGKKARRE